MSSTWRESHRAERGAYASVAQTEDAGVELRASGKDDGHAETQSLTTKSATGDIPDRDAPSAEDYALLPKVADKLPWGAFLIAIVELCERFAFYGLSGPFQNYMANEYDDPNGLPGAIGLKQSGATALSNFFQFWCYVTPIFGAIIADQYLGKYTTIKYFSLVYMTGIFVLFVTSLPISIENGGAFPGLIAGMVIIGLGTGGIKSNVSPLIAEQIRGTEPFVKVLKNGKKVIVDPEVTVQRVYMIFYMCINIGSVSAVATTTLELRVGFWSAFLLPLIMFCVGFWVLISGRQRYVIRPPQGGVIGHCFKALWIAAREGFNLDAAKASHFGRGKRTFSIPWDDAFIDELRTSLLACKVFLFFPIYWVTYSQMMNNFVSQGRHIYHPPCYEYPANASQLAKWNYMVYLTISFRTSTPSPSSF
jgi:dipeptide/tripeptide permease